jgi:NitT/TauT family transport system substrate-binding protein
MKRRQFLSLAAASGATIALPRKPRAQSRPKLILLVGTAPPDPGCHYFYYANENGYYAAEGIDVEFQNFPAETTAVRALVAGAGDVCWAGPVSQLTAIKSGAKIKVLSCVAPRLDYLVVAKNEITSVKSLEGHAVAVSAPGAISQIVPRLELEKVGGDQSKVTWVPLGNSGSRLQALVAKRVDAAPLNSGYADRAAKYDFLHIIADAATDLPNFLWGFEGVLAATVEKKHDALQAFVTATVRGARWAMKNPNEAALISEKILPDTSKELLEVTAKAYAAKKFWNASGAMPREAWSFTIDWMVKNGDLDRPYRYEDIVLAEFTDGAVKKLGPA